MIYPTWRYHRDGRSVVVTSPAEDDALGKDWRDTPDPKAFKAAKPAKEEAKPE